MQPAAVGIDGCSGGWVVAALPLAPGPGPNPELFGLARLEGLEGALAHRGLRGVRQFIDMPIGLPLMGVRPVDQLAQAALGPARASVFLAPTRPVLDALSFREAQHLAEASMGQGLSLQAWNIVPKIRAVDRYLRQRHPAPPSLEEAHPELAFLRLSAPGPALPSKKSADGAAARQRLLEGLGLSVGAALDAALTVEGRRVGRDDRLDALVLAYLATRPEEALECLGAGDRDALGLPMTLWAPQIP